MFMGERGQRSWESSVSGVGQTWRGRPSDLGSQAVTGGPGPRAGKASEKPESHVQTQRQRARRGREGENLEKGLQSEQHGA